MLASSAPNVVSKYVQGEPNSVLAGVLLRVVQGASAMADLEEIAEQAGLDPDWTNGIDIDLLEEWTETDNLDAEHMCQLVIELVNAGLSPVLDEPRPLHSAQGCSFLLFP